jgi:hypothetical protein
VRFHQSPATNVNTTSRHEFEPRSMTATVRGGSPSAEARVVRQLTQR